MSKVISDANLAALSADEQLVKELLKVHLKSDRKIELFYNHFKKFSVGGTLKYDLTFSWYAFFGNIFYFFYRKLYLPGLMLYLVISTAVAVFLTVIMTIITFIIDSDILGAVLSFLMPFLICSIYATTSMYFYIRKFLKDLELSGYGKLDIERVKENMSLLGGSNEWAVIAFVIMLLVGAVLTCIFVGVIAIALAAFL